MPKYNQLDDFQRFLKINEKDYEVRRNSEFQCSQLHECSIINWTATANDGGTNVDVLPTTFHAMCTWPSVVAGIARLSIVVCVSRPQREVVSE